MAYEVIDNFLSKADHDVLYQVMLSHDFSWFYNDSILIEDNPSKLDLQFGHNFYSDGTPNSEYFPLLAPLWSALQPRALVRVKANLNPITAEHYYGGWHNDFEFDCTTAVYYINTNNGYTEFKETGERVESVANRLVKFDSNMMHSGVSSTDTKARVLLNINYL